MKIALSTDEWHPIHEFIQTWLKDKGHEILLYGSYKTHQDVSWVDSTISAAEAVSKGQCDQAILCCWTGTGASIAANKVKGIRAAVAENVRDAFLARKDDDVQVLCLSGRYTTFSQAKNIITTFITTPFEDLAKRRRRLREVRQM